MSALRFDLKELAHPALGGTPLLNRIGALPVEHLYHIRSRCLIPLLFSGEHLATIFEIGSGNNYQKWEICQFENIDKLHNGC